MPNFVTYYVKPPPDQLEKLEKAYRLTHKMSYTADTNPDEILSIMFESVKKFHPEARCILLTDKESEFDLDSTVKIIRYPRKTYQLDAEVIRALIYYLTKSKEEVNTIFLEWDQVVQKELSHLFLCKYDLYIPYRRIRPAPFDDSFIGIGSGNFKGVIEFLKTLLREYRQLKLKELRYSLGKSLILSLMFFETMVKSSKNNKGIIALRYRNIMISALNGKKYGKRLKKDECQKYQKDAYTVHFSNKTRHFMKPYWEKFVKDK